MERHALIGGEPVSGSLFDFGLFVFHNARRLLERGSGPYFYLAKLESHLEAETLERCLQLRRREAGDPPWQHPRNGANRDGARRLRDGGDPLRAAGALGGLNAGRWDYIFSVIKNFGHRDDFVLPDRSEVSMTVPFMRAYAQLLVKSCHRRGAHAIGGMAAFIPSRRDAEVNALALAKVREDKVREAGDGFDGTWVAHPDLVPVAREVFDDVLGARPNQLERLRETSRRARRSCSPRRSPEGASPRPDCAPTSESAFSTSRRG